jgi:hypothetical protein
VAPVNSIGQGSWSTANTIGILAQTVPLQPGSAPTRDPSSSQLSLSIAYPFPVTS